MNYAIRIGIRDSQSDISIYRHHWACLIVVAFFSFLGEAEAAGDPLRYRAGLRLSVEKNKLNKVERESVINSLREKTGLEDLGFDEDGFLSLGDRTKTSGGSATARELLLAAMSLSYAIDIESHNHSREVAFARLDTPVHFLNYSSGEEIDVYPIQIDFNDFKRLRGDKQVLEAFDVGFVILHELGHAVLGLHDTLETITGLGECEKYINRIRHELGLPLRQNYIARLYSRAGSLAELTKQMAELNFSQVVAAGEKSKTRHYILSWEAREVGPIVSETGVLAARGRAGKPILATLNGQ